MAPSLQYSSVSEWLASLQYSSVPKWLAPAYRVACRNGMLHFNTVACRSSKCSSVPEWLASLYSSMPKLLALANTASVPEWLLHFNTVACQNDLLHLNTVACQNVLYSSLPEWLLHSSSRGSRGEGEGAEGAQAWGLGCSSNPLKPRREVRKSAAIQWLSYLPQLDVPVSSPGRRVLLRASSVKIATLC